MPGLSFIYKNIELPTQIVLQKIERNGVLIDAAKLEAQSRELGARLVELEARPTKWPAARSTSARRNRSARSSSASSLPVIKKTATGAPSTDEEVLQKLAEDFPLPKVLLEHRGLSKLKSTYTDKLPTMVNPNTGRVHTNYAQAVAITGRLASNDPNLQNIPVRTGEGRRIREAFIAAPGSVIVSADYSQIELRIMAHISGDEAMLKRLCRRRGHPPRDRRRSLRRRARRSRFQQRSYAKAINFGLIYGMSAFGLARLGIERGAAASYIDRYFRALLGREAVHGRNAPAGQGEAAMSRPCSAAACGSPKSTPRTARAAPAPNAPRSTRRCRARRPT
jgi:DNA polymerase-1